MAASPPGMDPLYDAAPCGLLLADADGLVISANRTLCGWLRCPVEELVGARRFQDLLTMGGRIFWQTHLQPLLRMQGSVAEVKLELMVAGAAPLPVMVNVAEQAWQQRRVLHVALFLAEDRHKYEQELLLQRRRAEELAALHARDQVELSAARAEAEDRAQFAEQLVGVVSHDIRNPLSVIHMSAIILGRTAGQEQHGAARERIVRSVQRMQHLISDLLDFSQARLGRGLSVRRRPCDLQHAIADAVAEWRVAFQGSEILHEQHGAGSCEADPDRIVQAVGNLVANAVNHGAKGSPVTVRSEVGPTALRVSVHNAGAPIPADLLPRLFEPMVRGSEPHASQGVGLGLFIVREIARAHGGDVEVASSAEQGTTFSIQLPLTPRRADAAGAA